MRLFTPPRRAQARHAAGATGGGGTSTTVTVKGGGAGGRPSITVGTGSEGGVTILGVSAAGLIPDTGLVSKVVLASVSAVGIVGCAGPGWGAAADGAVVC